MPRKPLKNRKLPPWIAEAVKHWQWQWNRLDDPLPQASAPEYSGLWMEEIDTLYLLHALKNLGKERLEKRFIEDMLRIERRGSLTSYSRTAPAPPRRARRP